MIKASINVTRIDKSAIIGNWKHMKKTSVPAGKPQGPADRYQGRTHDDTGEEIPF